MEVIVYCQRNKERILRFVDLQGHIAAIKALRSMFDESGARKPHVPDEFTGERAVEASNLSLLVARTMVDLVRGVPGDNNL